MRIRPSLLIASLVGIGTGAAAAWRSSLPVTGATFGPPPAPPSASPLTTPTAFRNPSSHPVPLEGRTPSAGVVGAVPEAPSLAPATLDTGSAVGGQQPPLEAQSSDIRLRAYALVAWGSTENLPHSERLCQAGDPVECLRLSEAAKAHQAPHLPQRDALAYQERAYSLLVPKCNRHDPSACVMIGRLHGVGFLKPDDTTEKALLARARQLCPRHPAAVCAAFSP